MTRPGAIPADRAELAEVPESWQSWLRLRGRLVRLPDGTCDLEDGGEPTRFYRPEQGQRERKGKR